MEDNNYNAFVYALALAVYSPSETYAQRCLAIAKDFSLPLDDIQFAKAKREVDAANNNGELIHLIMAKSQIVGEMLETYERSKNA